MNELFGTLSELFRHDNPFAWVIGVLLILALALIWRYANQLSTKQVFILVLLAPLLVVTLFLLTHYFPGENGRQINAHGLLSDKPDTVLVPTPRSAPRPAPKYHPGDWFLGTWQNVNDEAHTTHILEITKNGKQLNLRVRSKCCLLANASPNSITADRITLNDFNFSDNHYSNFSIEKSSSGLLLCKYTARLGDGRIFQVEDTMRKL